MKKANITIAFDEEKLGALEFSLKKEGSSVQARLEQTLGQLYERTVPAPVREYLDSRPPPSPARAQGSGCAERTGGRRMSSREVCVWLDERWYDALSRQLKRKDTTIEDELNVCLDEMLNQLPAPVYERISREIWEENQRQREAAEAARRFSVFLVTQDGRTEHLLTEGGASMDVLHTAMRLRAYLLRKGNSSERFTQAIPAADYIAPEVFQEYADELRQGSGRVTAALDIDLDRGEFSTLDAKNGWETYTIRDVSTAAWHANRKEHLEWERRLEIFAGRLELLGIAPPERLTNEGVDPPEGPENTPFEQTM